MALNKRIIARLDIKKNKLIKGVHLEGLRHIGSPSTFAKKYYEDGIDELILLDCVASLYGRNALHQIIDQITKSIYVPITIGGGINTLDQAKKMFNSGADKITLNSFAVQNPKLITEIANNFGSQAVTLSLQIKRKDNIYNVMTHNGREKSNKKLENWIKEAIERGIGEIMITSIDKEGTLSGFDIELLQLIRSITDLPIICSGGIASLTHVIQCFEKGSQAVAIASALHYKKLSLSKLKSDLLKSGIKVRH